MEGGRLAALRCRVAQDQRCGVRRIGAMLGGGKPGGVKL
jgi:hypothetical protein